MKNKQALFFEVTINFMNVGGDFIMHFSLLKSFEALGLQERVEKIEGMLSEAGYTTKERQGTQYINTYYIKAGVDYAFIVIERKKTHEITGCVLVDADMIDTLMNYSISFNQKGNVERPLAGNGSELRKLHRLVMRGVKESLGDKQIDHICHSYFINVREMLRCCDAYENNCNKKNRKKAGKSYNSMIDYEETWYGYMLHKLCGVSKKDLDLYQGDCIRRGIV